MDAIAHEVTNVHGESIRYFRIGNGWCRIDARDANATEWRIGIDMKPLECLETDLFWYTRNGYIVVAVLYYPNSNPNVEAE